MQENQEKFVARAWSQVQKVLEANRLVQLLAYAMQASRALYGNLGSRFDAGERMAFFAPVLRKVRASPTTIHDVVSKPFSPRELMRKVRELLGDAG